MSERENGGTNHCFIGRERGNDISAQEWAVCRRWLSAGSWRNPDVGFHGRVFLCLRAGGFLPAPPPPPIIIIIIIKIITVTITVDEASGL